MRRYMVASLTLGLFVALVGSGVAQQGTGEKVGDKVDRAIQDIKKGVKEAAADVKEQFQKTKASVHAMGVESRVYGRLHWDKALNEASVEIHVDRDGVATLKGTVADGLAKTKAITLASDTVGVKRVVDRLTVITDETPTAKSRTGATK
jgi:osmotically-inducible protein OsmY